MLGWIEKGVLRDQLCFQSVRRKAKRFSAGSFEFSQTGCIASVTDFESSLCFSSLLAFLALLQVKGASAMNVTGQPPIHFNSSKVSRARQ